MIRHPSVALPLAVAYWLLVVYATLYPFSGWRWPAGSSLGELLALPLQPLRDTFDAWANFIGYVPLGALVFHAGSKNGQRVAGALMAASVGAAALSFGLEFAQQFIPGRYPSQNDWFLNSAGAFVGCGLAWGAWALGLMAPLQRLRDRWFFPDSGLAIALMILWPVGLLFPSPVPMGLGQVFGELRALAETLLAGTPWEQAATDWLEPLGTGEANLSTGREALAIGLGLLAPCMLAAAATRPGWRRVIMAPLAAAVAFATITLSTALNFGPEHALTWLTPITVPAMLAAMLLAAISAPARPQLAAACALVALTALVTIVAEAPADPYYAASLRNWEQGRFIHFNGLAQWVTWLWPYGAILWLLRRLGARQE